MKKIIHLTIWFCHRNRKPEGLSKLLAHRYKHLIHILKKRIFSTVINGLRSVTSQS